MKIVFISNFINHYMVPLLEELNQIEGCQALFVETIKLPDSFRKGGFSDIESSNYLIKAWENKESYQKMENLAVDADVLVVGAGFRNLMLRRLEQGKLTIEGTERPLKKGLINAFSPTILKSHLYYHLFFHNKPLFKLCQGAYTAKDEHRMYAFKNRCFKFGYFPRIPDCNIEESINNKTKEKLKIVWCARFIKWKHPELAVKLAERLVNEGYDFELNMIGSGVIYDKIHNMILNKDLSKYVHLLGNFPNDKVLEIMSQHHIFLFTSDGNEGWGVVLNEAMGQGCCPVASHLIGATPFLLKHKKNGMIYESGNADSLFESVRYLIDHPNDRINMAISAYNTVKNEWSPRNAARRLEKVLEELLRGNKDCFFEEGPLSKAEILSEDYNAIE